MLYEKVCASLISREEDARTHPKSIPSFLCNSDASWPYSVIFVTGPDEDTPRPMECFEFISRAPTNLFRLRTSYPPFLRSKPDLSSLFEAAEDLNSKDKDLPLQSVSKETS